MKREWKPVPPTQFYYSMRAEWFRREADKAALAGDERMVRHFTKRAREYADLANQLPIGEVNAQAS